MTRREELLAAAVAATRGVTDAGDRVGDRRAYFRDFKAMQLENCADVDRPIWESIGWPEVELELRAADPQHMDVPLRVLDRTLAAEQVDHLESLLGPEWRDRTFTDLLSATIDRIAADAGIDLLADPVGREVVRFSKAIVVWLERGERLNETFLAAVLADLYGSPESMTADDVKAAQYVLGIFGLTLDL